MWRIWLFSIHLLDVNTFNFRALAWTGIMFNLEEETHIPKALNQSICKDCLWFLFGKLFQYYFNYAEYLWGHNGVVVSNLNTMVSSLTVLLFSKSMYPSMQQIPGYSWVYKLYRIYLANKQSSYFAVDILQLWQFMNLIKLNVNLPLLPDPQSLDLQIFPGMFNRKL